MLAVVIFHITSNNSRACARARLIASITRVASFVAFVISAVCGPSSDIALFNDRNSRSAFSSTGNEACSSCVACSRACAACAGAACAAVCAARAGCFSAACTLAGAACAAGTLAGASGTLAAAAADPGARAAYPGAGAAAAAAFPYDELADLGADLYGVPFKYLSLALFSLFCP